MNKIVDTMTHESLAITQAEVILLLVGATITLVMICITQIFVLTRERVARQRQEKREEVAIILEATNAFVKSCQNTEFMISYSIKARFETDNKKREGLHRQSKELRDKFEKAYDQVVHSKVQSLSAIYMPDMLNYVFSVVICTNSVLFSANALRDAMNADDVDLEHIAELKHKFDKVDGAYCDRVAEIHLEMGSMMAAHVRSKKVQRNVKKNAKALLEIIRSEFPL